MDEILTTNALVKKYGSHIALKDISIHVPPGCIYALAGRNGAGKTTLIRLICGLQAPTGGSFSLYGCSGSSRVSTTAPMRRRERVMSRLVLGRP